ncbi:MAG: hypothetical protein AB7S86_09190 [Hydrogenophaga sp.]
MNLNLLDYFRNWQLTRQGVPEIAYIDNTWDTSPNAPRVMAVRRGASEIFPVDTTLSAAALNQAVGVDWEQAEALQATAFVSLLRRSGAL